MSWRRFENVPFVTRQISNQSIRLSSNEKSFAVEYDRRFSRLKFGIRIWLSNGISFVKNNEDIPKWTISQHFKGKKEKLSTWHDGLINYLSFYWKWIKACWGFHSASAMPIPIDSPRLLSHISHSYLWYCGFSVVGSSSSMTWEIKTLLIPDKIIKNLQLNRNRFVLIRFQPPSKKKKKKKVGDSMPSDDVDFSFFIISPSTAKKT